MSASFAPSLKHIILAKIAIQICNDPEVRCFVNKLEFVWDKMADEGRWNDLLGKKAAEKTSELNLPYQLHQGVLAVIRPIALEIARWKSDHLKVLGDKFDFLSCEFYWKPEGIIDREKTAKMLVLNKKISKKSRFFLACFYCLENEAQKIWNFMSPDEESRAYSSDFCVTFWRSWIHRKGVINWTKLSQRILNELYPSTFCNYRKNPIWLRCFFNKLTPEEKERCIKYIVNNTFKDHDNFRFSVSQLDENQIESVFKENPARLVRFFLDWPYQSLFSEASEQMWKYLQEADFKRLLHFIIYNRITAGWYDFDYVNLLKDFWRRSPKHFKEYIKKDSIFEPVKMVIHHDFLKPFPKKEIVDSSSRFDLISDKHSLLRDGDFLFSY